jgi:hypothetical protein
MPWPMFLDFVFQRYHWSWPQFLQLPEYLLEELSQVWSAEGAYMLKVKGTTKTPLEGPELIAAAREQGFDLPDSVTPRRR